MEYRTRKQFLEVVEQMISGNGTTAGERAAQYGFYANDLVRANENEGKPLNDEDLPMLVGYTYDARAKANEKAQAENLGIILYLTGDDENPVEIKAVYSSDKDFLREAYEEFCDRSRLDFPDLPVQVEGFEGLIIEIIPITEIKEI